MENIITTPKSSVKDLDKKEKRNAYQREYNRKKKESKLLPLISIKEKENENEEEDEEIKQPIVTHTIETQTTQKEKVKHFIIKPDFTLLLKNHKNHRRLMKELMIKTIFLEWEKKNYNVIEEFNEKAKVYNYYHEKCDFYEDLFCILEREITLPFVYWVDKFEIVMTEYRENQL